jgi:hypothetical protein
MPALLVRRAATSFIGAFCARSEAFSPLLLARFCDVGLPGRIGCHTRSDGRELAAEIARSKAICALSPLR